MSRTIEALERIDQAKFHNLCDDLLSTYFGYSRITPIGVHTKRNRTIAGTPDSVIFLSNNEQTVMEYTVNKDFKKKLRQDLATVKEKLENRGVGIEKFIFVTGGRRENFGRGGKRTPERYIKEDYGWDSEIIDQELLRIPLDNSEWSYIRRRYLDIPDDYFQSKESFEKTFADRARRRKLYIETFVERSEEGQRTENIKRFVAESDKRILLIVSTAGIGKTRFAIEAVKQMESDASFEDYDFLFNRIQKTVPVNEILSEISKAKRSVVILDDAHKIDNLGDFRAILDERPNVKIILTTRATAVEEVASKIGMGDIEHLELRRLNEEESRSLAEQSISKRLREEQLDYVLTICEGNPMLIGIASHLINAGSIASIGDLKRDYLVESYFREIIQEIKQRKSEISLIRYEPYLCLVHSLRPFSLNDRETRQAVRELAVIDEVQENYIVRDLTGTGVVEQVGDTLWIYPDILGEYIVNDVYFGDPHLLDIHGVLQRMSDRTKTILQTLREIDTSESNDFIREFLVRLQRRIGEQKNDERSRALELVEIVANNASQEALKIVDCIFKGKEWPKPKYEDPWLSEVAKDHTSVLSQCIGILRRIKYQLFDQVVEELLQFYLYKARSDRYESLREEAGNVISEMAAYNLNVLRQIRFRYIFQQTMFEKVQEWAKQGLQRYLPLVSGVCQAILNPEAEGEYYSRLKQEVSMSFGPLPVTEELQALRRNCIAFLTDLYAGMKKAGQKVQILKILNTATQHPTRGRYGDDMKDMVRDNTQEIINFYITIARRSRSPLILQEIEEQAHWIRKRHKLSEADELIRRLMNKDFYSLYRALVGSSSDLCAPGEDWEKVEEERKAKMEEVVATINKDNCHTWIKKLAKVAETYEQKGAWEFSNLRQLLSNLGVRKPGIARVFVDESLRNGLLGNFDVFIVQGIRESNQAHIADGYIDEWLESGDEKLILKIPQTYHRGYKGFRKKDVEVFSRLLQQDNREIDQQIVTLIRNAYYVDPEKCFKIIQTVANRADETILHVLASQILEEYAQMEVDASEWPEEEYTNLIWNFVRLPELDWHVLSALAAYGKVYPLRLVDFFEARIKEESKRPDSLGDRYRAVPLHPDRIGKMYQNHPEYSSVIKRFLSWIESGEWTYQSKGRNLLSGVSPDLDEKLEVELLSYISSGEKRKILAAVEVLGAYEGKESIYDLCKAAIEQSQGDDEIWRAVSGALLNTGTVAGWHGFVCAYQAKVDPLKLWLQDESGPVRSFAREEIARLQRMIAFEDKRAAEEGMAFKKGVH